jgi:hypothetical protein
LGVGFFADRSGGENGASARAPPKQKEPLTREQLTRHEKLLDCFAQDVEPKRAERCFAMLRPVIRDLLPNLAVVAPRRLDPSLNAKAL